MRQEEKSTFFSWKLLKLSVHSSGSHMLVWHWNTNVGLLKIPLSWCSTDETSDLQQIHKLGPSQGWALVPWCVSRVPQNVPIVLEEISASVSDRLRNISTADYLKKKNQIFAWLIYLRPLPKQIICLWLFLRYSKHIKKKSNAFFLQR